ncbi:sodium:solute symporter family protein [Lutibacter sp. TH_r2]|uniref:sodium:solute symporter family protein n=1 Tax=Lutibacter sp. TH_r2 TaxID=3082083 RepID=UPI0029558908|nr:sodium:solute symporter family protein [Lutibacter sp. TH_r2]MDV7186092.1 sodium:solute symporter family protein [Lutibacter sp. TH_r2]
MKTIDLIIGIVFLAFLFYFIFKKRKNSSFNDFTKSNQSLGVWVIFASLSATFIGPGFSLGLVNEGFNSGYFLMIVTSFYGLSKIFEGTVVAKKIRTKFKDAHSIGDIIAGKESHNNNFLHLLVGLISFALLIGFSAVIAKAGGELLNHFTGINKVWSTIIIISIVTIYSFFGGIKASIYTDMIQFVVFIVLIPVLLIFIFTNNSFDFSSFNTSMLESTKSAINTNSIPQIIALACTWFFGEMLIPPTINRILSTNNSSTSKKALIYSGLFMIFWLFIMLILGGAANVLNIETSGDQTLLLLGENYLNYGLYGVFIVALISIVMSSLDSLINSGATVFTQDIITVYSNKTDKNKLMLARIATIIISIFAVLISFYFTTILSGLLFVYSVWAPAILVALFASIFFTKMYWQSAFISIILGITTSIVWSKFSLSETIPSILLGIIFSFIGYYIVHKIMAIND